MNETPNTNLGGPTKSGFEKSSFNQEPESKSANKSYGTAGSDSSTIEKGKQLAEVTGVKVKKAGGMIVSRIKQNPLSAVGIALGAGVGFALLRR